MRPAHPLGVADPGTGMFEMVPIVAMMTAFRRRFVGGFRDQPQAVIQSLVFADRPVVAGISFPSGPVAQSGSAMMAFMRFHRSGEAVKVDIPATVAA